MNYNIVSEVSIDELIREVNEFIRQGYKPIGGISIMQKGDNYKVFYQTVIK